MRRSSWWCAVVVVVCLVVVVGGVDGLKVEESRPSENSSSSRAVVDDSNSSSSNNAQGEEMQWQRMPKSGGDALSSFVAVAAVGVALIIWLKSREGFNSRNAVLITLQTILTYLTYTHAPTLLTRFLNSFDWSVFTSNGWRSPKGLLAGLLSVIVWHIVVLCYYALRREMDLDLLQRTPPDRSKFFPGLVSHFARPEAFVMVFGYLCGVWMFDLLPASYYDFEAPSSWVNVLAQFLVVDFLIFASHWLEHAIKPLYRVAHKQHHKYINPSLFVAFSGSVADTFCQILVPLFITAHVLPLVGIHVRNWDFVVFGSMYANQFMLLHIEYRNPWDHILEMFSIGTSEDHNVHHATFNYNYGHFFMVYDKLAGTYRSPLTVRALVRSDAVGGVGAGMDSAATSSQQQERPTTSKIGKTA